MIFTTKWLDLEMKGLNVDSAYDVLRNFKQTQMNQ